MNISFHIILIAGWLFWVLLHSVLAMVRVKQRIQRMMGSHFRYYRLTYSVFAAVTLLLLLVYQFSHGSPSLFSPSIIVYAVSVTLTLAGAVVMAVCIRKYFINLSGVDVLLKREQQSVLETKGLHTYVRHPLYSGTLLFVWALFLSFPLLSNLIACAVMTVYTLIGIEIEEEKLVAEFGASYQSYAASTPKLIPSLWRKWKAG